MVIGICHRLLKKEIEKKKSDLDASTLAEKLRKNVWDVLSKEYAKYKSPTLPTYALIILPKNLSSMKNFLEKTLLKTELPSLNCDRFGILFYDNSGNFYILRKGGFKLIQVNTSTPLKLDIELLEFNETNRKK